PCALFISNQASPYQIYSLSLHDALPIYGFQDQLDADARELAIDDLLGPEPDDDGDAAHQHKGGGDDALGERERAHGAPAAGAMPDRKSTRLNSSHSQISYAVFCLKKKIA